MYMTENHRKLAQMVLEYTMIAGKALNVSHDLLHMPGPQHLLLQGEAPGDGLTFKSGVQDVSI